MLALFYWRERRSRPRTAFTAFTEVCAAAFLINLLLRTTPRWETPLTLSLDLITSLVPPLLLHMVTQGGRRPVLLGFYGISVLAALAAAADDLNLASVPFRDQLPVILLGVVGATGLFLTQVEPFALRLWYRALLGATMVVAAINLTSQPAFTILASDFLLLAFFCVTLYYQGRLIFFDLLIKLAAFAALASTLVTAFCWLERLPDPVTVGLGLTPLLLLGPWADRQLGRWIDRTWLRRQYPAPEAERLFTTELQLATTERELRARAEQALAAIFNEAAQVCFSEEATPQCTRESMVVSLRGLGWVIAKPRGPGLPYMSDDHRLVRFLVPFLGVMLENVRFREQRRGQQMREQELLLLAGRAKLKALRAQVNPHFLFNALNTIAGLIPIQPALADQTVEELATFFRYTLRKSEDEWVRLEEEAEFVRAYLRVEQARFGDRLRVQIEVDPEAEAVPIPGVSIQPLIENAVRHGALQAECGGIVTLRASLEGESLLIEVSDNGPGFPEEFSLPSSTGHGLRNISDRLSGYYGESAELRWESSQGKTRVYLKIPLRTVTGTVGKDHVEIVGEAETVAQAMELTGKLKPRLAPSRYPHARGAAG